MKISQNTNEMQKTLRAKKDANERWIRQEGILRARVCVNKPVLKKLFSAILKIYKGVAYYEKSHILKSIVIKRTSAECTALLHSAPLHEVSSISEQASRLGTCETA